MSPDKFCKPLSDKVSMGVEHQYTIPVEWSYGNNINDGSIESKWVTQLRCICGQKQTVPKSSPKLTKK